jgi:hypothetical protein
LTRGLRHLAATAAAFAFGGVTQAQTAPPTFELVPISVEVDGWTILPIASDGATSHLIATRDDHMALATDIDVVLYGRTATGWLGSAYDPSVTLEDAAIDLAAEFGLTSPMEGSWLIDLDPAGITGHILPRADFESGFFTADPLYMIAVQLDDPDPLAEAAEQSGFPAATSTVNTGRTPAGPGTVYPGEPQPIDENCLRSGADVKDVIAAGMDAYASGTATNISEVQAAASTFESGTRACCLPITWTFWSNTICTSATPWTLSTYSIPVTILTLEHFCVYQRTVSGVQTRLRVKQCFDCTVLAFTQVRGVSQNQRVETRSFYTLPAAPPPCPGPPSSQCTLTGSVSGTGPFAPPPPACP